MTRGMIYKAVFIVCLVALCVLLILPTVGEKRMEIHFSENITAGQKEAIDKKFSQDSYLLEKKDHSVIVKGSNLTDAIMNEMRIYPGVKEVSFLKHPVEEYLLAKKINLGLDLQGGMHLVLRANFESIQKKLNRELTEKDKYEITQQALELLRNRVDKFGVSEPSIRPSGSEAIEIQLPGVKNPKGVKNAIGTTGSLEYRFVEEDQTLNARKWFAENMKDTVIPEKWEEQKVLLQRVTKAVRLPNTSELLFLFKRDEDTKKVHPVEPLVLEKKIALAGTDIQEAAVDTDEYNRIVVRFKTTAKGSTKLASATAEENKGKRLAIVLDNKIRSAPSIQDQISTGNGNISGSFTRQEALTLARIIKEGALPVDLSIIEERTVGPSLGQDSIESGVKAITIGLLGIMIFMLIYYKAAGIIATLGLVLNIVFMLAILSLLGFTLTLPGIAGFILTVGMAVDANVIVYERIKEEIRAGKSPRMSIMSGFDKAFWTIFDANLTTMIAAFILSQFGTGPIKGFAVTLFIGILSSMFVVLYITRFVYEIISLNKKLKKLHI